MKHYLVTSPGRVEAVEKPIPVPGADEVLVRVTHTAISPGSNVYIYRTGSYTGKWTGEPQDCVYMGSGVVERVGAEVSGLAAGDPVAMNGVGHQEFAAMSADKVHRLPEGVDPAAASLSYLAGWSVSALHLGRYAAAENVVVVGLGLVGASAAMVADMMGARVLGIDVAPERLECARNLGIGEVVQGGTDLTNRQASKFLGDRGADLFLETSGSWHGFRQAFDLARDYSRIALMGLYRDPPPGDLALELHEMLYSFPSKLHYQKIDIIGCGYDPEEVTPGGPFTFTRESNFEYLLEQIGRGRLPIDRLTTHRFEPDDIGEVLDRFVAGDKAMVGVVFDWT